MNTGIVEVVFIYFAVLLIASLSGFVSEKAGIVNIGINGMMIIGALVFRIMGNALNGSSSKWTIVISMFVAAIVVGLFALLHGLATIVFKANHVVSGTAINLLASGLALYLTPILASKLSIDQSVVFHEVYIFQGLDNTLITTTGITYFIVSLFIAFTIFIYFKYTKFGLRHASVGENPNAADSASVSVIKYKWLAVFGSGFLAGIAGSMALAKIGIFNGNVQGLGFVALAIMILGQWRIPFITLGALFFAMIWGYLSRNKLIFNMPENIVKMLPFIFSLLALVGLSRFQAMPKALGKNFDKSKR